jgi:hypothetical protein
MGEQLTLVNDQPQEGHHGSLFQDAAPEGTSPVCSLEMLSAAGSSSL